MSLMYTVVVNDNGDLKTVSRKELEAAGFLYHDMLVMALDAALDTQQTTAPVGAVTFAAEADAHTSALFSNKADAEAYCAKMRTRSRPQAQAGYRPVWRTRRYEIDQRR